jgi:hypothetical protein
VFISENNNHLQKDKKKRRGKIAEYVHECKNIPVPTRHSRTALEPPLGSLTRERSHPIAPSQLPARLDPDPAACPFLPPSYSFLRSFAHPSAPRHLLAPDSSPLSSFLPRVGFLFFLSVVSNPSLHSNGSSVVDPHSYSLLYARLISVISPLSDTFSLPLVRFVSDKTWGGFGFNRALWIRPGAATLCGVACRTVVLAWID